MSDNTTHSFRIWELSALLALCAALLLCTWAQGRQNAISSSLVRLHVVAASDSPEEQALKLRVRDAVLEHLNSSLSGTDSARQASRLISQDLSGIERAARSAAEGRELTVTLGRERFPTKRYQGFTLPAGEYESLRVVIGPGLGHNWWCIVFPPVCLSAVQGDTLAEVMSDGDYAIVSEDDGYQLRFRVLELWGQLSESLSPRDGQNGVNVKKSSDGN